MSDPRKYREAKLQAIIGDIQTRLGHIEPLESYQQAYKELLKDFAESLFSNERQEQNRRQSQRVFDKDLMPILLRACETADPDGVHSFETDNYGFAGGITFPDNSYGEYFDIRPLNEDYLAIIMCDARAGHGFPNILDKTRIAGFFDDLCAENRDCLYKDSEFKPTVGNRLYHLNNIVQHNEMSVNIQIHFINVKTGKGIVSYAGDNWIHYWDKQKNQIEHYRLGNQPGLGRMAHTFGRSVYECYAGPYPEVEILWSPGDIIFFLNDGLQQSRRYYTDAEGARNKYAMCPVENIIEDITGSGITFPVNAQDVEKISENEDKQKYIRTFGRAITLSTHADDHKTDVIEDAGEFADRMINGKLPHPFRLLTGYGLPVPDSTDEYDEFGFQRIFDIVENVLKRKSFTLEFVGNRPFEDPLVFDFSNGSATPEEIVRAVFSVERVFRLRPESDASEEDRVRINRTQIAFLLECTSGLDDLFSNKVQDLPGNVAEYSHLSEDSQEKILSFWCYSQK